MEGMYGDIKNVRSDTASCAWVCVYDKGADVFVDGASKIAVKCNIPEMVVGLTIVAMGTSAQKQLSA